MSELEFRDLEELLKRAPLRPPSPQLDRCIAAALRPWRWKRPTLAAAAVIGVIFGTWVIVHHRAPAKPTPIAQLPTPLVRPSTKPVSISRTYGGMVRDGIVGATADGQPLERYRRQTIHQTLMLDPKTGRIVTICIPKEEVYVVAIKPF